MSVVKVKRKSINKATRRPTTKTRLAAARKFVSENRALCFGSLPRFAAVKFHIAPASSATEIRMSLGISQNDLRAARAANLKRPMR